MSTAAQGGGAGPGTRAEARLNARAVILAAWLAFHTSQKLSTRASMELFAEHYNEGELQLHPPEVQELVPDLCRNTLARWYDRQQEGGTEALAASYGNRKGQGCIDVQPEVHDLVVGELVARPTVRASHVYAALQARFGGGKRPDIELPCARSLRAWMAEYRAEHAAVLLSISNPDAYKSKYLVALGDAAQDVVRLNQRWELDSSPADVMLTDGRYTLIGLIDVYSRRARLLVCPTSKSVSIGLLVRRALLEWGVPERAVTDNGQDYTSVYLTRVFLDLNVHQKLCTPFSPEQKPFIERFFRTFAHGIAELLEGYIGHNVAERKAIESRKSFADRLCQRGGEPVEVLMDSAKLQTFCDRWCTALYQHSAHEGLDGKTPWQVAAAWQEPVRRVQDERALDVLLAEPAQGGTRRVQKKGIKVENAYFGCEDLPEVGTQVYVKLDPADVGRIFVFSCQGQFLCVAKNLERLGAEISRAELAVRAKHIQRQAVAAKRKELRLVSRRARVGEVREEILQVAEEQAARLAALPRPAVEHSTAALAAAGVAATASTEERERRAAAAPVAVQVLLPVEAASVVPADELARRRAMAERPSRPRFSTPWGRAWWCAGEEWHGRISHEDAEWLERWRTDNRDLAPQLAGDIEARYGQRQASH